MQGWFSAKGSGPSGALNGNEFRMGGPVISEESQAFIKKMVKSKKMQHREPLLHSFAIAGLTNTQVHEYLTNAELANAGSSLEVSEPQIDYLSPQLLECYPHSIYNMNKQINEEYLYLQSVQSVCFMEELTPENKVVIKLISGPIAEADILVARQGKQLARYKMLHYTITDGAGNKRYLSSLIFNEIYHLQGRPANPQDSKQGQLPL